MFLVKFSPASFPEAAQLATSERLKAKNQKLKLIGFNPTRKRPAWSVPNARRPYVGIRNTTAVDRAACAGGRVDRAAAVRCTPARRQGLSYQSTDPGGLNQLHGALPRLCQNPGRLTAASSHPGDRRGYCSRAGPRGPGWLGSHLQTNPGAAEECGICQEPNFYQLGAQSENQ
jgi:hypothetical protein